MVKIFEYSAFISYKREDEKWAKWLQHKLEHYRLPTIIAREKPDLPKKLNPVFKDTTDIKPGDLAEVLKQNLEQSKYLIVICSPLAAQSVWVGKEILEFIALGKQKNIILFIVDGEPYSNNPITECYHSVIKEKLPEMLGVNINEKSNDWKFIKKQKAFIRVVSTILDVSFDTLWKRQRRRLIRKAFLNAFILLFFIICTSGISYYQHKKSQRFNVRIGLKEISWHNKNLPFENGKIYLCYGKDTLKKPINNYSDIAEFNDIPGEYRGKKAWVRFEMFGYENIDTMVNINELTILSIRRDNSYGIIFGTLKDECNLPIEDVVINVKDIHTKTDRNGKFLINIPLINQSKEQRLIAFKKGYQLWDYIGTPSHTIDWKIILKN